jgi:hypothetical protein
METLMDLHVCVHVLSTSLLFWNMCMYHSIRHDLYAPFFQNHESGVERAHDLLSVVTEMVKHSRAMHGRVNNDLPI